MMRLLRKTVCSRVMLCGVLFVTVSTAAEAQQRFEQQREAMVQRSLEAEGIRNPRVLEAMRKVPRHEFVRTADRSRAYEDTALPIGNQQTISPPYVVAYMTEVLDPGPEDRVLRKDPESGRDQFGKGLRAIRPIGVLAAMKGALRTCGEHFA